MPVILRYPLDPTGTSPNNLVQGEPQVLTNSSIRCAATKYGAFFSESLRVKDVTTQQFLNPSQYEAVEMYEQASIQFSKEICSIVLIKDTSVSNNVLLTYQALGGEFSTSQEAVIQQITQLNLDNRPAEWGNILDKPSAFPPAQHLHDIGDLYGFEYIVQALERLKNAIEMGDRISHDQIYAYIDAHASNLSPELQAYVNARIAALKAESDPFPIYLKKTDQPSIAPVRKPINLLPGNAEQNVTGQPVLIGNPYYSLYGVPQGGARFRMTLNSDGSAPYLFDVTTTDFVTAMQVPVVLTSNQTYYWQLQYKDAEDVWSAWSDVSNFKVQSAGIVTPMVVSPANNENITTDTPTLIATPFQTVGYTDTLAQTEWEIWTGPSGSGTRVYNSVVQSSGGPTVVTGVDAVFSIDLWNGATTVTVINSINLKDEGGMVITKDRNLANNYTTFETLSGDKHWMKGFATSITDAQYSSGGYGPVFRTDGFSVSDWDYDPSAHPAGFYTISLPATSNFVSWTWRRSPKFFDVLKWTGNGQTTRALNHILGVAPGMVMVKDLSGDGAWQVYHRSKGQAWRLYLDNSVGDSADPAITTSSNTWAMTAPDANAIYVGDVTPTPSTNASGRNYIAYVFAHDPDTVNGLIQCGTFTSTVAAQTVVLGWQPQFLLYRKINSTDNWHIADSKRGWDTNRSTGTVDLKLDTAAIEAGFGVTGPTSNGFTHTNGTAGDTYIFVAVRASGGGVNNETPAPTITVPSGRLINGNNYYPRVRHVGASSMTSSWSNTSVFTTLFTAAPVTLGQAYGGGYWGGNYDFAGNTYAVIVAPKASGQSSKAMDITGGNFSTATSATDSIANTTAWLNGNGAATYARALNIGGFSDWQVPAKDVLNLLATNLKPSTTTAAAYQANGAEVFDAGNYLSSTNNYYTTTVTVQDPDVPIYSSQTTLNPHGTRSNDGTHYFSSGNPIDFSCYDVPGSTGATNVVFTPQGQFDSTSGFVSWNCPLTQQVITGYTPGGTHQNTINHREVYAQDITTGIVSSVPQTASQFVRPVRFMLMSSGGGTPGGGGSTPVTVTFTSNTDWVAPSTTLLTVTGHGASGAPAGGTTSHSVPVSSLVFNGNSHVAGALTPHTYSRASLQDVATAAVAAFNVGGSVTFRSVGITCFSDNWQGVSDVGTNIRNNVVANSSGIITNTLNGTGAIDYILQGGNETIEVGYDQVSVMTTGADATGFSKTFPGGVGGAASSVTFNNVGVIANTHYSIVVPSGGQIQITYTP